MSSKKFISLMLVLMLAAIPAICAVQSSSAEGQHYSGTDEVFSRAFVTHMDNVHFDEHQDRTNVYFFIPGSENETKFLNFVNGSSSEYPSSDDRSGLSGQICNIYSVDMSPRWPNILRAMDMISFHVSKGEFITINMTGDSGEHFYIDKTGDDYHDVSYWGYGHDYTTTADVDMNVSVCPYNPYYSGGTLELKDLFTTVSYTIDVSADPPNYGDSTVFIVMLFIIAAAGVAVIILSIRRPEWAKVPKEKSSKKEEPPEEETE